jgi:hypothetical protein
MKEAAAPMWKTEIDDREEPPHCPGDAPLSAKVGTKCLATSGDRSVGIVRLSYRLSCDGGGSMNNKL